MKNVAFILSGFMILAICYLIYDRRIRDNPSILIEREVSKEGNKKDDRPLIQKKSSPPIPKNILRHNKKKEKTQGVVTPQKSERTIEKATAEPSKKRPSMEDMEKMIKNLSPKELAELEKYYENVEAEWMVSIKNLMVKKLSLDPQSFRDYLKIRSDFQKERAATFREFHENMMIQYGEGHTYNPTEYEKEIGDGIREEYHEQLRSRLGDENFSHYIKHRNKYNERIAKEQDPYKGLLKIQF